MAAVNFINVKHARFSYQRHLGTFFLVTCMLKKLPKQRSFEKGVRKTLMKLTPGDIMLSRLASVYSHILAFVKINRLL